MRTFSVCNLAFFGGLLLSVRVMLAGGERGVSKKQSLVRTRWAVLAGSLTLAGFTGSFLLRTGAAAIAFWAGVIIATAAGGWGAWFLVRRAAARQ